MISYLFFESFSGTGFAAQAQCRSLSVAASASGAASIPQRSVLANSKTSPQVVSTCHICIYGCAYTQTHTHTNIITIYMCVCMYICLLIIYLFVYLFVYLFAYTYLFIYPSLCKVHRMKGAGKSASPSVDIQLPQIFRKIGPQKFLQTPIVSHHMFIDYTYICSTKVRKIHGYPGVWKLGQYPQHVYFNRETYDNPLELGNPPGPSGTTPRRLSQWSCTEPALARLNHATNGWFPYFSLGASQSLTGLTGMDPKWSKMIFK